MDVKSPNIVLIYTDTHNILFTYKRKNYLPD